ncbi:uncharacterized protein At4g15970-like [Hordeum vulgare subsp. vulgare]|nr:uncharacterized protein At4g15970-like [Hordeum vulgare subsp. vulgare]
MALIATTYDLVFLFFGSDRNPGIHEVYNRHRASSYTLHSALWTVGGFGLSAGSLAMSSVTNLLCFVLGAAATAAFVALLPPSAPRPYAVADLGMRKLSTAAAASDDGLAELLRSASMEDKTVILTLTNEAHAMPGSVLQIMLDSLRTGVRTQHLLKHLVVVATDPKGLERCRRMHPLCHLLVANGMSANGTKLMFYDKDYVDMMWARNRLQARVLALGYTMLFTDLDILWFRNPLLRIPVGADITLACDNHFGSNPYDLDKAANSGFVYARPTAATLAFFEGWYEARTRWPGENDQVVFREMKHELAARHGATVYLVDTTYFHNACEEWKKFNFHEICIFHAACIHGLQDKIDRLHAVLHEWRQFQAQQLLLGANSTALTY